MSPFCGRFFASTLLLLLLLLGRLPVADSIPQGFADEYVARMPVDDLVNSGTFATASTGDTLMFLASKTGPVYVVVNPHINGFELQHLITLEVCTNRARGIQSILPHPNFTDNGWLYVYKTDIAESCEIDAEVAKPQNRLSKFTITYPNGPGGIPLMSLANEQTLFLGPELLGTIHNGGAMDFGKDGMLWIILGDGEDRRLHAYNPRAINSAVLRITENGNIPEDNPYYVPGGPRCNVTGFLPNDAPEGMTCPEIWSQGLRSPYSLAMNPFTPEDVVEFWIGDVGAARWEEFSVGGTRYKEANYGWDHMEGPCRSGSTNNCPLPTDPDLDMNYTDPEHWWIHTGGQGCAIAGEFIRDDIGWPEELWGDFLFADYAFNQIYLLHYEGEGYGCRTCIPPTSNYRNETFVDNARQVVDFYWGPYGDPADNVTVLYYLTIGWTPSLRRIRYTGDSNRSPQAVITFYGAPNQTAVPGTRVTFRCDFCIDPDGDEMTYLWRFGDGTSSTSINASRVYHNRGRYTIDLIVTDSHGLSDTTWVTIQIGIPPDVVIEFPPEGATFAVDDKFTLIGEGLSFDENGNHLPLTTDLQWEVRQVHADHWHVFLAPTIGNHVSIDPAPSPEDFYASTNSYLLVRATATDEFGLTTTVERAIMPRLAYVDLATEPSGLIVYVDRSPFQTPGRVLSWENHNLLLGVEDQDPYSLIEWSTGETERSIVLENLCGSACFGNGSVPAITVRFGIPTHGMIASVGFDPSSDELTITTQDGKSLTTTIDTNDADSDPTNEQIAAVNFDSSTGVMTITEGGTNISAPLDVDVSDNDSNPSNERITAVNFEGSTGVLTISEGDTNFTATIPEASIARRQLAARKTRTRTDHNDVTVQRVAMQAFALITEDNARVKYSKTRTADSFVMARPGRLVGFSITLNEAFHSKSTVEVFVAINGDFVVSENATLTQGDLVKAVKFTPSIRFNQKDTVQFFVATEGEILKPERVGAVLLLLLDQKFSFAVQ